MLQQQFTHHHCRDHARQKKAVAGLLACVPCWLPTLYMLPTLHATCRRDSMNNPRLPHVVHVIVSHAINAEGHVSV